MVTVRICVEVWQHMRTHVNVGVSAFVLATFGVWERVYWWQVHLLRRSLLQVSLPLCLHQACLYIGHLCRNHLIFQEYSFLCVFSVNPDGIFLVSTSNHCSRKFSKSLFLTQKLSCHLLTKKTFFLANDWLGLKNIVRCKKKIKKVFDEKALLGKAA